MILEFVEYIEIRQRQNFYCSGKYATRAMGVAKNEEKKTLTEHCYYFRRHDNSLEDEQRIYNAFPNVYRQKIKSRDCFSGRKGFCC